MRGLPRPATAPAVAAPVRRLRRAASSTAGFAVDGEDGTARKTPFFETGHTSRLLRVLTIPPDFVRFRGIAY